MAKTALRKYQYEFEWRHRTESSAIISMKVLTPRSGEFVSQLAGPGVVVYDIMTNEPTVRMGVFSLQTMIAIVAEIKHERVAMIEAKAKAAGVRARTVSINEILAHKHRSFKAEEYIE